MGANALNSRDDPAFMQPSETLRRGITSLHALVALCFLAVVVGYTDRVNLAVASVAMREQLNWSQTTKGLVLSSFFVGYISLMAVSGWLATRFGGVRVLGFAVLVWSLFTLATPPAATTSLAMLIAVRIGMGLGEAAMFPACYELIGRWLPPAERTRAVTRILSGIPVGTVAGLAVSGWLVTHWGWEWTFYVFGVIGVFWCLGWWRWWNGALRSSELSAAAVTGGSVFAATHDRLQVIPWRRLFREPAIWALFVGHFSANWLLYFLLSWLPSYFKDGLGLTITDAGLFSAGPWVAMAIATTIAGAIADSMAQRGISMTLIRKTMQTVGLSVPAACLFLLQDVASATTALVLICLSAAALGCSWAGYAANAIDLAPRHAGLIMGVSNTFATVPGIVGVSISGWLFDVTGTFSAAFLLTAAISAAGAIIYLIFASAKPILE